jgi:2-polyprenyl-3-methyl-5-hydroxy-6-metoxy-1,4-benzoquinol methylase
MNNSNSKQVETLLAKPEVHQRWESGYRTEANERFYEQVFDYILKVLSPAPGATILDAGCGPCAHSARLARRGFRVQAVDFSESALEMAAEQVRARGLEGQITLRRESLLGLSFPDESFDYVLCWGVLMHIPEVERAVAELARVVKPGGQLVISEANMRSLEAVGVRGLKRLLKREKSEVKEAPAGVEYWMVRGGDALVTRQADIGWLVRAFEGHGLALKGRVAGQFSEAYTLVSAAPLKKLVHHFNDFWFRHVKSAGPAFGNILFLQKK